MASASNKLNQGIDNEIEADLRDHFSDDMLSMLSQGTTNDLRIILRDGEITANKDVLAARCEYFAANFRWKEETKDDSDIIEITDCSKEVMKRILHYLFTGHIKFKDLGILQQLELVNQIRKLLLKGDLHTRIESNIVEDILPFESIKTFSTKCIDIISAFQYADKFALERVRCFLFKIVLCLLPHIAKDSEAISTFSTLPLHIIEKLFLFPGIKEMFSRSRKSERVLNSAKFRCFWSWYQVNKDTCQEVKKKILGRIDLDLFRAIELYQLVKPSGLFPADEVEKRIVKCLRERDEMISQKEKNVVAN